MTITPTGWSLSSWAVTLTFSNGEVIDTYWQTALTAGTTYTFTSLSYNGNVASGQSASFGFNAHYGSTKGSGQPGISNTQVPTTELTVTFLPSGKPSDHLLFLVFWFNVLTLLVL